MSVVVAGVSVLVAGDLSVADETDLVSTAGSLELPVASLRADVLVVPHHGAALDAAFLDAVHPRVAVVSVGRGNSEHDPAAGALNALSTIGARTIRTDEHGNVAIVLKSGNLRVATRIRRGSRPITGDDCCAGARRPNH